MNVQEFMDRMRRFVAEEPDGLSMEQVAMCATMIEHSRETTAIVLADFIDWIIALREDAMYCKNDVCANRENLDQLVRRAIDVRNARGCDS